MESDYRALAVVLLVATSATLVGFTFPASAGHGTENGNYTVNLPFASDHYPRGENGYNASINHYAAFTPELFEKNGAPKGIEQLQFIIISNQDIDFSECTTENTAAFGIDRDSDDPGTNTDVSLLSYREDTKFKEHSIVIDFYEGDEIAASDRQDKGGPGENPEEEGQGREDGDRNAEVYPDDEIVAHQGYKSSGGACYGMPEEPGWYQIDAFGNGTAFNGNEISINPPSHYFYICKCDSEAEAREKLGPPPSERSDPTTPTPTETPTATATATATPTPVDAGSDGTDGGSEGSGSNDADRDSQVSTATPRQATATATEAPDQGGAGGDGGGGDQQAQQSNQQGAQQNDQRPQENQQVRQTDTAIPTTPTIAEGPGFGPGLALVALLGAALLAVRR
jgi:PGF-CTERM protein